MMFFLKQQTSRKVGKTAATNPSETVLYGGFLTTMGFPTKNDHFGGVLGVPTF